MKKSFNKVLAVILSLLIVFSAFPAGFLVFAIDNGEEESTGVAEANLLENSITAESSLGLVYGETGNLNASATSGGDITYSSSDSSVAAVDSDGTVTAKGVGEATITMTVAADGEYKETTATDTVKVTASGNAIIGYPNNLANVTFGSTVDGSVTLASGAVGTVTYTSSNESFATVDENGNITIYSIAGEATITATFTSNTPNYKDAIVTYIVSAYYIVEYDYDGDWTNEGTITITGMSASDTAYFKIDDDATHYEIEDGEISVSGTEQIKEGTHTIYVYVNGIPRETFTVKVDITDPKFTVSNGTTDYVNKENYTPITVSEIADEPSGIASIRYTVNGIEGDTIAANSTEFTIGANKLSDGENEIVITVTDNAGNVAVENVTVYMDKTDPEVTLKSGDDEYVGGWFNDVDFDLTVDIQGEDEDASGVDTVEYTLTQNDKTIDEGIIDKNSDDEYILSVKKLGLEEGEYTLTVTVTDKAGNETEVKADLKFDETRPVVELEYESDGAWITAAEGEIIGVSVTEDGSGEAKRYYKIDDGPETEFTGDKINIADLELEDGTHAITVCAEDKAGNTGDSSVTVKLDTAAPKVTWFNFERTGDTAIDSFLNTLTYGGYYNEGVKVTVTLSDNASGLTEDKITLTATSEDGKEKNYPCSTYDDGDGTAVFIINDSDFNEIVDENNVFKGTVSVTVTDNAGNETVQKAFSDISYGIEKITWEQNDPEVKLDPVVDADYTENEGTDEEVKWYRGIPEITFSASDEDSGIVQYKVSLTTVNDDGEGESTLLAEYTAENVYKLLPETGDISLYLSDVESSNGSYTITATVYDTAGNCTTKTFTFYVDDTEPYITEILFDGETPVKADPLNSDEPEYKYYFQKDTEVTITATDNGMDSSVTAVSSGLCKIHYKLVSYDKTEDDVEGVSEEVGEDGSITFAVGAGFKGDIIAYATDNAGNKAEEVTPDSIIIETQDDHNDAEEHITMTLDDYADDCWYNEAVNPIITVTDTCAGIKDISVTVDGDSLIGTYGGDYTKDNFSEWDTTESDDGLITSAKMALGFSGNNENCSNITITVTMTDNCGNTSEETYTFNIDSTKPEGAEEYTNDGDATYIDGEGLTWYNGGRTLTATVTEREIADAGWTWTIEKKNDDGKFELIDSDNYSDNGITVTDNGKTDGNGNGDNSQYVQTVAFTKDGVYKVSYTVTDMAGNTCTSAEETFGIDTTAPTIASVTVNGSDSLNYTDISGTGYLIFNNEAEVTVTLEDAGCGIGSDKNKSMVSYYTVDAETDNQSNTYPLVVGEDGTVTFSLSSGFNGEIHVIPYDNLGNSVEDGYNLGLLADETLDKHESAGTHVAIEGVDNSVIYNAEQTVEVTVTDKEVGIASVSWSIRGSTTTLGTLGSDKLENYGWDIKTDEVEFGDSGYTNTVVTKVARTFTVSDNCSSITVTVKMQDYAGNTTEKTVTFGIDMTDPTIDVAEPEADETDNYTDESGLDYYSCDVTFGFAITERDIKSFEVTGTLNGEDISADDYNKEKDTYSTMPTGNGDDKVTETSVTFTKDGTYNVTFTVTDQAGNTEEVSKEFVIDKTSPVITSINFEGGADESKSAWKDALNLLTFGIFYNDDVKVTVEAEDKEETSASDIQKYTLYIDGEEYDVSTDGTFTIKYANYDEQKEITVTATDNVNNTCDPVSPTDVETNAQNSTIMLESSVEEITISATGADMYEDFEGNIWYSDDVEFSVTVTDELSGIRSITAKINDSEPFYEEYYEEESATAEKTFTLNTSEVERNEDGSYTIYVEYTDNAGNTTSATSTVYKDTDAPEITSVTFEAGDDASNSIWGDIWNLLKFGTFYNDDVKVTVTAKDESPATEVKGYTLYLDDTKYAENTDGVFTITYDDYTSQKKITVTATDNVNHTCNAVSPTDVDDTNANNDTIMLEQGSSVITIDIPESTDSVVRYDTEGNVWYSGDIDFTVNATDELSGIRNITASINGTPLYNSDDSESYYNKDEKTTTADEFTVNTRDADINDNGSYVLTVNVTDNAGNVTTATKTVYKDTTDPVVTDITFTADGSAWSEALNLLTFGIFYNDDVKVTVEAEDNAPATGIKEFNLYIGGELYKTNSTGEFTIDYETYDEQKEITVTVTDNVNNTCEPVSPTDDDVETNARYNTIMLEQGTSSITITLPETDKNGIASYTDSENRRWYGEDAVLTVDVTDELSGIRSITADVNGLALVKERYNEEDDKIPRVIFEIDTEEANSVIEKDGSYTLTVTVTDNAGNEISAQQTVYTDMTAPEITDITFESGKDEPNSVWDDILNLLTFGIFYNDDVKVTVSAVDRLDESAGATADTVKTYTLYIDGEEYDVNEDGVFTITYENYTSGKLITAMVTDYAGNNSSIVSPTDVESNAQNSYIMLENSTEEISLSVTAPSTATSYTDSDSKIWYSEDVDFNIAVTDAYSGIRNITVTINGKELRNIDYYYSETHSEELTVNTSEAVRAEDGSYTICVEYTDNAGNTTSTTSTIYKDIAVPVVTSVIFEGGDGASKSVWEDVLNLLTFGTFYNDDVKVTVTARDDSPATGVKEYTLYIGGELYAANSTGVFTIDYKDYDERQEITVTATDNVNNTCAQVTPTSVDTNAGSDMIMLESDTEDITVSVAAPDYTDSKNNYWYSDDVDFNIAVTDDLSGIRSITVSINGTELRNIDYYASETHSESLTVNTSEAARNEDGSYTVYVEYTDNAGNTASATSTVYKDISVPVVTAVTFEGGADEPKSVWEKALNLLTFGIFYNDDVKVTVAAEDDYPTSGIKEYTLYIGGEKYAVSTDGTFTIEYEDYTSQKEITVTATDNVNNTCNRVTPTSVDTNAGNNTIMLEKGTSAIAITLPGTDKNGIASHTDSSGKVWYAEDAVLSVKVTDELSGIRSIEASVNGLTLYTASFNEEATKTTSDSFTIDTEDANSVMRADGSYTLTVTVTDNAGNEVAAQQTVYTDRTAPEITDITFESGADEPNSVWNDILNLLTFGIFYNDDVKVTVSAVDRLDADADATAETVETYTLYIDGEEYETNSTGVFVIAYEDYTALKRITAEVTDYAGNNSGKINPADVSSDAHNSNIMLESSTEDITLSVTAPSTATSYTDSDSKIWY
ncbi:MAG: Ig-like domain-containing protein, partial [Clostridiales bacterium]|nr:Ig-like domain-containing protein [Clostridiales bacterium]